MKKVFSFAAIVIAAVFATSCTSDEIVSVENTSVKEVVSFRVTNSKGQLRASETTMSTFSNFKVFGNWTGQAVGSDFDFMNGLIVENYQSGWTYQPERFFPQTGDINFYAYSPATSMNVKTAPQSASNPAIDYVAKTEVNEQEDFLYAKAEKISSGKVSMQFSHALSQVVFSAKTSTGLSSDLIYTIDSIGVDSVFTKGRFNLAKTITDTDLWTSQDSLSRYNAPLSHAVEVSKATGVVKITSDATGTGIMLIPQTGDLQNNSLSVFVRFTIKDKSGFNYTPAPVVAKYSLTALAPNTKYDILITFGDSNGSNLTKIEFEPSITPMTPSTQVEIKP